MSVPKKELHDLPAEPATVNPATEHYQKHHEDEGPKCHAQNGNRMGVRRPIEGLSIRRLEKNE